MVTETVRCPACGGQLNVNVENEFVKCPYCGNTIRINMKNSSAGGTVFYDDSSKIPLGTASIPQDCQPHGMVISSLSSAEYPITIQCSAVNPLGTVALFFTGEGYVDATKCPMLTGMYSTDVNRISCTQFRQFQNGDQYLDNYVSVYAGNSKAEFLNFVEYRDMPIENFDYNRAVQAFKQKVEMEKQLTGTNNGMTRDLGLFVSPVCKVYEIAISGIKFRIAVATVLEAYKYQLNIPTMPMMPNFGGLFGNMFSQNQTRQTQQNSQVQPGSFGDLPQNGVIGWRSNGVFMLQARSEIFDKEYERLFKPFCSSFKVDDGIIRRSYEIQDERRRQVQNYTQQNIQMQNQQFQANQRAHAQVQAAMDAKNQAWWNNQNASYAANRARSNAAFSGESSADRISRLQSEAIRGVNTYVREDGSEVEVSVDYDHAYTNAGHDTYATNSSFSPGGNWEEMYRK